MPRWPGQAGNFVNLWNARTVIKLPTPARLALEMALHEEQERRALEGELRGLEIAWQAAEEVAAISDDLLLSDEVRSFLAKAKES